MLQRTTIEHQELRKKQGLEQLPSAKHLRGAHSASGLTFQASRKNRAENPPDFQQDSELEANPI